MDTIQQKFNEIRLFCQTHANHERANKYARFFKEGYDAYGIDKETFLAQSTKWLEMWKEGMDLEDFLKLGNLLVKTGKYEEASFAIHFIAAFKDNFNRNHFEKIGCWLENGIANWGHTDVLSGLVLSVFLKQGLVDLDILGKWVDSESKWKRRAVPVTLIEYLEINQDLGQYFNVIEPLMMDKDVFVQKGLGWLLRETWKMNPQITERFLFKWKDQCGRTIIQYATEKMSVGNRKNFKKNRKQGV